MARGVPGYSVNVDVVRTTLSLMGETLSWLSLCMGRETTYMGKVCRGEKKLSPENVDKLCYILDLGEEDVLLPSRPEQDKVREAVMFDRQTKAGEGRRGQSRIVGDNGE